MPFPEVIHQHPRGWWFRWHTDVPSWWGPFPSAEAAEETARKVVSNNQKEIEFVELQMWAQKTVKVKP